MKELIYKDDAIAAVNAVCIMKGIRSGKSQIAEVVDSVKGIIAGNIREIPGVNLKIYGYRVEELKIFAEACAKANIKNEDLHRLVMDAGASFQFGIDEASRQMQRAAEEAMRQIYAPDPMLQMMMEGEKDERDQETGQECG